MSANRWLALGLLLVAAAVIAAGRWMWADGGEAALAPEATLLTHRAADMRPPALPPSGTVPPVVPAAADTPLPPMPDSGVDAAASMAKAIQHGDPQAPAVVRDAPPETASAAELADPAAYQRYEARQSQRLYRQYVQAADAEIPRLQADIERARKAGLPPEQIAEGEEKLRRIQAMRDQLQADHPEAMSPSP